jgi:hypothetical protein
MLCVAAPDLFVVLKLASRRAERVGDGDVHVLVVEAAGRLARDCDLSPRHRDIDVDVEGIAMAVVMMRLLDDHRTALDASVTVLEPRDLGVDHALD